MEFPENKKIVLFDGVCNLCNASVLFIIKRDHKDQFRFAALQSPIGEQFLKEREIDRVKTDSIILYEPKVAYYTRSSAALKIGKSFGGLWPLIGIFEWIPESIRDFFYNLIARNRYRWFGRQEHCMIPTPELQSKFL
ncbi:MAG: DCC1-like thiol-disulfide oxidoreductase family protein [Flavobacteriaceae bacterium]